MVARFVASALIQPWARIETANIAHLHLCPDSNSHVCSRVLEAQIGHPVYEMPIAPYANDKIALYHLVEKFRGRQFKRRKCTHFLL